MDIFFFQENVLVTGGEGKEIHVIDIEKEKCLQSVKGHNSRYLYGLFKHFSVKELGLTYLWQQRRLRPLNKVLFQ